MAMGDKLAVLSIGITLVIGGLSSDTAFSADEIGAGRTKLVYVSVGGCFSSSGANWTKFEYCMEPCRDGDTVDGAVVIVLLICDGGWVTVVVADVTVTRVVLEVEVALEAVRSSSSPSQYSIVYSVGAAYCDAVSIVSTSMSSVFLALIRQCGLDTRRAVTAVSAM